MQAGGHTGLLAVLGQRQGLKTAVLDADITGPSIPKMFGVHDKATGSETAIFPVESAGGIPLMSINLLPSTLPCTKMALNTSLTL